MNIFINIIICIIIIHIIITFIPYNKTYRSLIGGKWWCIYSSDNKRKYWIHQLEKPSNLTNNSYIMDYEDYDKIIN